MGKTKKVDRTTKEYRRLVEQEGLIADASELILEEMERAGVNQVELARRIGKSKGFVSQVLSGSRNMTMRTFADLLFALDARAVLGSQPVGQPRTFRTAPKWTSARAGIYTTTIWDCMAHGQTIAVDVVPLKVFKPQGRQMERGSRCQMYGDGIRRPRSSNPREFSKLSG